MPLGAGGEGRVGAGGPSQLNTAGKRKPERSFPRLPHAGAQPCSPVKPSQGLASYLTSSWALHVALLLDLSCSLLQPPLPTLSSMGVTEPSLSLFLLLVLGAAVLVKLTAETASNIERCIFSIPTIICSLLQVTQDRVPSKDKQNIRSWS